MKCERVFDTKRKKGKKRIGTDWFIDTFVRVVNYSDKKKINEIYDMTDAH